MSNFLAIATVTEVLRQMLDAAVKADVSGAVATAVRPIPGTSSGLPSTGVNVYLYRVSSNPAWRSVDLPTRRDDGTVAQTPRAGLDLDYLLTFYGVDSRLEAQRILGCVVRTLHAHPVLLRSQVRAVIDGLVQGDPNHYLRTSDLDQEVELVKFTPLAMTLEELSKLWSVFFQTPSALSLAYQASVVLIEGKDVATAALPVREPKVVVVQFQAPTLESVSPQVVESGEVLTLRGRNLSGSLARVVFDTGEVVQADGEAGELHVPVPASLRAGVRTVRVRHDLDLGTAREPHASFSSSTVAFALAPIITKGSPLKVKRGDRLSLTLAPAVGRDQEVILFLGEHAIPIPKRPVSDPPESSKVTFPISATFTKRDWLARVQVDGVQSRLRVDENPASPTYQQYVAPKVTVT